MSVPGTRERREMRPPPTMPTPRKLPIIVVADVSGSMKLPISPGDKKTKIELLNENMRDLLDACKKMPQPNAELNLAVITFGNGISQLSMPLTPVADIDKWTDLTADGDTPLGQALTMLTTMLENRNLFTHRDFRPILVLASDGAPTDDWQGPLERLNASARAKQPDRLASAIGAEANRTVLGAFVKDAIEAENAYGKLFEVGDEASMVLVFKATEWLSKARSSSRTPDAPPPVAADDPFALAGTR